MDNIAIRVYASITLLITAVPSASEGKDQLKRYLSLHDLTALAFITRNSRKGMVEKDMIDDDRYLHPEGRGHFLWSDFHDAVEGRSKEDGVSPMVASFLYLLQGLGLCRTPLDRRFSLCNPSNGI